MVEFECDLLGTRKCPSLASALNWLLASIHLCRRSARTGNAGRHYTWGFQQWGCADRASWSKTPTQSKANQDIKPGPKSNFIKACCGLATSCLASCLDFTISISGFIHLFMGQASRWARPCGIAGSKVIKLEMESFACHRLVHSH